MPVAARSGRSEAKLDAETLEWLSQYLVISGVPVRRATQISKKYAAYFLKTFEKNRPEVAIITGDTRLQSRAAALACRTLGIRHYYFEQGPFGTTIFDSEGVNCTASFAKTFDHVPSNDNSTIPAITGQPKMRERKAVRALDFFVQPLVIALGFLEIREEKAFLKQVSRQLWLLRKSRKTLGPSQEPSECSVLVIGQVPTDANFSLNSPYSAPIDVVRDVEEMFPSSPVLFREHPLYIKSYGADFYSHFERSPKLSFSRGTSLDVEIEAADHVVVVNSTAGMEVLLKHQKPVLVLGDASYLHLHGVHKRVDLAAFVNETPTITEEAHAANWAWFRNSFQQGHFRDLDLQPVIAEILKRLDED
ncbi:MAG: hypothetical protein AB8B94_12090 [Hyphomicrobiales bacterium]